MNVDSQASPSSSTTRYRPLENSRSERPDEIWCADIVIYEPVNLPGEGRRVPGWKPRRMRVTWPTLKEMLTHHQEVAEKEMAPAWSPITMEGSRRCNEAVVSVSCLVLDVDDGCNLSTVANPFLDWPHLVYTTFRSTVEVPRARLVVPFMVPVPAEYWPRVWRWAQERLGQKADEQAKDRSRVYYLPSIPVGGHGIAWVHDPDNPFMLDPRPWDALPVLHEPIPPSRPRTPGRVLPRRLATIAIQDRLSHDAAARRRAAELLGMDILGPRAKNGRCPRCGRPSVWFYWEGNTSTRARCDHRKSCGWVGPLWELGGPDG